VSSEEIAQQHKSLTMTVLATPDMTNFSGNVHGGKILNLIDQVAYACATRYSGSYVFTISVDFVTFRERIHVGELVTFMASVNRTGMTSMEVGMRVESENIRERTRRHVVTCYLTMIRVNEDNSPTKAPTLLPLSDDEKRRWEAAKLRRAFREEIEQRSLHIRLHPEDFLSSHVQEPGEAQKRSVALQEKSREEISSVHSLDSSVDAEETDETGQHKTLHMTVLMTPNMANFSGNVQGGKILDLLDQVAYACASRYSGHYVVTLSVDQVVFMQQIHVGELVTFQASINYTGTTSMEMGVRVIAENIRERISRHVITCYFTMVAVDDEGKPTKIPQLEVKTDKEKRRWAAGKLRRELRKEIEQRNLEIRQHPEHVSS
jgi:acyl-CoA hydrolase